MRFRWFFYPFIALLLCRCEPISSDKGGQAQQSSIDENESARIAEQTPSCKLEIIKTTPLKASVRATVQGNVSSLLINGVTASPSQLVEITFGENKVVTAEVFGPSGRNTCSADVAKHLATGAITTPSCVITASQSIINRGETVTLNWTITGDIAGLSMNGVSKTTSLRTATESPTQTTTYQLLVENGGLNATCSVNVQVETVGVLVIPPGDPTIQSFSINGSDQLPGPVAGMSPLVFAWTAINTDSCTLFKDNVVIANTVGSGTHNTAATGNAIFKLTCSAADTSISQTKPVSIQLSPGINVFTVNDSIVSPMDVTLNAPARIAWSASNVESCSLLPFNRTGLTGSHDIAITADTTVTLRCHSGGRVLEETRLLRAVSRPMSVERFVVASGVSDRIALIAGSDEAARVSWSFLNAQSCAFHYDRVPGTTTGPVPAEGSMTVRASSFTRNTYIWIQCTNGLEFMSRGFQVNIIEARPTINRISIRSYESGSELTTAQIRPGEKLIIAAEYGPPSLRHPWVRCEITSSDHTFADFYWVADRAFNITASCGHIDRADWDSQTVRIVPQGFTTLAPSESGITYFKVQRDRPTGDVYTLNYNDTPDLEFFSQNVDYCKIHLIYNGNDMGQFGPIFPAGRQVYYTPRHTGTVKLTCFKAAATFTKELSVVYDHDPLYYPSGTLRVNGIPVVSVLEGFPTRIPANFNTQVGINWSLSGPRSDACVLTLDYGSWTTQETYSGPSGTKLTKKILDEVKGKMRCANGVFRDFVIYPSDDQLIKISLSPARLGSYRIGDTVRLDWSSAYYQSCTARIGSGDSYEWVNGNPGSYEWAIANKNVETTVSCKVPTSALTAMGVPVGFGTTMVTGFDHSVSRSFTTSDSEVKVQARFMVSEDEIHPPSPSSIGWASDSFVAYPSGERPKLIWIVEGGTCDIRGGGLNVRGSAGGNATGDPISGPVAIHLNCINTSGTQTKNYVYEAVVDKNFADRGAVLTMSKLNMPSGRVDNKAYWTGTEMVVYGGLEDLEPNLMTYTYAIDRKQALGTGGRFNPSSGATGTWQPMATANFGYSNSATIGSSVHWTGTHLIVWGGYSATATNLWVTAGKDAPGNSQGKLYNPRTNTWTDIPYAPVSGRYGHASVWTGTELVIFGGYRIISHEDRSRFTGWLKYPKTLEALTDLAAYNPTTNTWRVLSNSEPWNVYGNGHVIFETSWIFLAADNAFPTQAKFLDNKMFALIDEKLRYYDMSSGRWTTVPLNPKYGVPKEIHIVDGELMVYVSTYSANYFETAAFYNPTTGAVRYQKFAYSKLSETSAYPIGGGSRQIGYSSKHFILESVGNFGVELIDRQTGLKYATPKSNYAVTLPKASCYGVGFGASVYTGENAPAAFRNKVIRTGGLMSASADCLNAIAIGTDVDERQFQHTEIFSLP